MALYKSTLAANAFAKPPVKTDDFGESRLYGTTMSLTTDHDSADVVALFPVPTTMQVRRVYFSTDGTATAGAADIGLYTLNPAGDTATAVDADLFASAQAITTAADNTEVVGESGQFIIAERFQPLWQAAGASADPGGVYWVCLTITTNVDATTVVSVEVEGKQ